MSLDRQRAVSLLESSRIEWRRDWDALVIGFLLGVLTAAAVGFGWRAILDENYRPVQVEQR